MLPFGCGPAGGTIEAAPARHQTAEGGVLVGVPSGFPVVVVGAGQAGLAVS